MHRPGTGPGDHPGTRALSSREYGARGLAGILTPQANTTVEAELALLMEPDVACVSARLTCRSGDSRERLLAYWSGMGEALAQFDTAPLDVAAFACTGSTYLVGLKTERHALQRVRPAVHSAAGASLDALAELRARRIAIVSPYPPWLTEACTGFWRAQGIEVADVAMLEGKNDTRSIYALRSRDALAALGRLNLRGVDAVLISGTGMPSLGAIAASRNAPPVLSSNLCLAWRISQAFAPSAIDTWLTPKAEWRARYAARFPSLQ